MSDRWGEAMQKGCKSGKCGLKLMSRSSGWVLVGIAVVLGLGPGVVGPIGAVAQTDQPTMTILSPKDGDVVTTNTVAVMPDIKNWKLRCDLAGTRNVAGAGHYHLELDGALVNMYCGPAALSLQNVKPGEHTITILPAKNDHSEVEAAKTQVKFTYQPTNPLPPLQPINAGKPSVSILWPKNGATVSGASFPLVMDVRNYRLSCDMLGKPKVANTGHWHVDVNKPETAEMGMMKPGASQQQMMMMMMEAMATMMNMGCNNTFDVPLAGVSAGKHNFYVVLVDNAHEPLNPAVTASVSVNVKK
jgi:hypothetical protein